MLNQVGLVHVLKRVRLLTNGRGQGLQTRWTTLEPGQKKRQQLPVQIVQPFMINPEGIKGVTRNTQCDHAVGHDLGIVAHPSQEAQSHAGGAPGSPCNLGCPEILNRNLHHPGRPDQQFADRLQIVELQPKLEAEPVPQRRRQESRPGRRADQGESLERQPQHR